MSEPANPATMEADGTYLSARGILSWLFSLDHKRIGLMQLIATAAALIVASLIAVALRKELSSAAADLFQSATFYEFLSLHAAIMVYLFVVPSIPASLGNFLLPLMIGSRSLAFPRLNLLAFYFYLVGAILFCYALVCGAFSTGWTFFPPASVESGTPLVSAMLSIYLISLAALLTGINFIVTIHKMRAPQMVWKKLPIFVWSLYAASLATIFSVPAIGVASFLLMLEKTLAVGIFDPAVGGDPLIYQHLFWFFVHPLIYVAAVPALGAAAELIAVHSRRQPFGYRAIVASLFGISLINLLSWGKHIFSAGQSELASVVFSLISSVAIVPAAVLIFSLIASLYRGSVALTTPMIFALCSLLSFTISAFSGLLLGSLAADAGLRESYFFAGHLHYLISGTVLAALIGGLHHWWPKISGRIYNDGVAKLGAVAFFLGIQLAFFPKLVLGYLGFPMRQHAYEALTSSLTSLSSYQDASTIGAYLIAGATLLISGNLAISFLAGRNTAPNPWLGSSLEWESPTPPPPENFSAKVVCKRSPYEFIENVEGEGTA